MALHPMTPVIIGVGQRTVHWSVPADSETPGGGPAPMPQDLRADVARRALDDSGAAAAVSTIIDRIVVVRTMLDSVPGAPQPFGCCANPPATLADDLGLAPHELIYGAVGGDQPQALVNESAEAIFTGEVRAALLCGAEANAAMKVALKAGASLDWTRSAPGTCTDRGLGPMLLSPYDIANGLGAPTQTYPVFEHAMRARLGHSVAQHRDVMSALWAGFSAVAAANPHAQFPRARDPAFLSTPSAENYPVADPYLKWDVAQDAVNQAAAVIMTSVAEADRLGIAADRRIYLHGYASATDKNPSERADLSRSAAITQTLHRALDNAGVAANDIALFDLYSCFPVAVLLAAEALGINWRTDPRPLTVIGGLPFFGGAGNNYSMHAIATMVDRLRQLPGQYGLILANGGFLSKEAAGVYSTAPRRDWSPVSSADIQAAIDDTPSPRLVERDCSGTIETYTVTYVKGVAQRSYAFVRTADGARALARTAKGQADRFAAFAAAADPIGRTVQIRHVDGVNLLELPA